LVDIVRLVGIETDRGVWVAALAGFESAPGLCVIQRIDGQSRHQRCAASSAAWREVR
jgi:hypothetical protein